MPEGSQIDLLLLKQRKDSAKDQKQDDSQVLSSLGD